MVIGSKKASLVLHDGYINFAYEDRSIDFNMWFYRTMRVPLDGEVYELPETYGQFPLSHIEDYIERIPADWVKRGGILMPMYQSEALLIRFSSWYPMAIKIAVGKVNALSGEPWRNELSDSPQDYLVCPQQQALGGFYIAQNIERQFVAMPLGDGLSPEEQINNVAEYGGIQIIIYPLKKELIEEIDEERAERARQPVQAKHLRGLPSISMSLALGGKIYQEIYEDEFGIDAWDKDNSGRCFVQMVNSQYYKKITGRSPPHWPLRRKDYIKENIPSPFQMESRTSLVGSKLLNSLKTIIPGKG